MTDRKIPSWRIERLLATPFSRRSALKLMGLGAAAMSLPLPGCSSALKRASSESGGDLDGISPIDRSLGSRAPRAFSGDNPDRTHRILWDKAGYLASKGGKLPEPSERVPLVVIGGGISGLTSAYLLREHKPVVLERAERLGGNARGESWDGLDYSIGAAYFMEPSPGSDLDGLMKELELSNIYRVKEVEDPVVLNGRRYTTFWEGDTAPGARAQFRRLHHYFRDVYDGKNGHHFPDIPVYDSDARHRVEALDRETFTAHLERIAGGKLHPHVEATIEHFSWSSFGAPACEVSAAAGLNFFTGEFGKLLVTPGGNSAVAERIMQRLLRHVPRANVRTSSVVFDVETVADGVRVAYEDPRGEIRVIHAAAVVMACPKFVVNRILRDIEPERSEAIRKLRYNAYLVANVLLNKPIKDDFYDLYLVGDGTVDRKRIPEESDRQRVTDVVLGTFAKVDPERSILTLYRGLPYPGGRPQVYADGAYERFRGEFERQVHDEILAYVGATPSDVADLRVTRWGHPLPAADAGLIAGKVVDAIQKPFRGRVFFVEQDNWMLPAFETAAGEALHWAPKVDRKLRGIS